MSQSLSGVGGSVAAAPLVRSRDHEAAQRMYRAFDDTLAGIARRREELAERGIGAELAGVAVPAEVPPEPSSPTVPGTPVEGGGTDRARAGRVRQEAKAGSGDARPSESPRADGQRASDEAAGARQRQEPAQAQTGRPSPTRGPVSGVQVVHPKLRAGVSPSPASIVGSGGARATGGAAVAQNRGVSPTVRAGGAGAQRLPGSATVRASRARGASSRVQRDALIEQIQRGLAQALKKRDGELTLRLRPEHLGLVRVRVRVEESSVSALLEATSEQARGLLKSHLTTLREALEARGLSIERIDVEHDPGAQLAKEGGGQHRHGGAERHAGQKGRSPERVSAEPAIWAYEIGVEALIDVGLGRVDALA